MPYALSDGRFRRHAETALKALEILVLLLAPMLWGLGSDFLFERIRRGRVRSTPSTDRSPEGDDA